MVLTQWNKKEQSTDTCNNVDESQKYFAKQKKLELKGYIRYDSIY